MMQAMGLTPMAWDTYGLDTYDLDIYDMDTYEVGTYSLRHLRHLWLSLGHLNVLLRII